MRSIAREDTVVAAATRIGEFGEDRREQALLVGAQRAWRRAVALRASLEPRFLGHLPQELVHLTLHAVEVGELFLARELAERRHVDDRGLRVLQRLLDLLEQPLDPVEFALDGERLRDGHLGASGEAMARGELVDLEPIAQARDRLHERARER